MHTIPYAAWAAIVTILTGGAPALLDADAPAPCEPPACLAVTHGFVMNPPVAAVGEGGVVEWRAGSGHHWLVEAGTAGGCLGLALGPDTPAYRVTFLVDAGHLYALHHLDAERLLVLPCASAFELPGGALVLRYACALHAREGGIGLLLVAPAAGDGAGAARGALP